MKLFALYGYSILFVFFLNSCLSTHNNEQSGYLEKQENNFQHLLDRANVQGSILILDESEKTYFSNDFVWAKQGFLPASTFKIPNAIGALENGIVANENTVFFWDKEPRRASWDKDMTFIVAFKVSCVPCFQQIARETGVAKMKSTLKKIHYPGMVFDSTNLDVFWLRGDSRISQFQQIEFLKSLKEHKLKLTNNTYLIMNKLMFIEVIGNMKLWGKTGWAEVGERNIGWFVGYAEVNNHTYYFAVNISPGKNYDLDNFTQIRKELALKALSGYLRGR